jgi:hypothetical protein
MLPASPAQILAAALVVVAWLLGGSLDPAGAGSIVAALVAGIVAFVVLGLVARPSPGASEPVDGWPLFLRELERARRHGRRLALVRLTPGGRTDGALAERVRADARVIDLVWHEHDAVYLGLPEADREVAERVAVRLCARPELAAAEVRTAVFPDEALTTGALMSLVAGRAGAPVPLRLQPLNGAPIAAEVPERRAGEGGS